METPERFEARKRDHIQLALEPRNQTTGLSGLDQIRLLHEALPDINLEEVDLSTSLFGSRQRVPFFVSSMTAGHHAGVELNQTLAVSAGKAGWPMGVGSQRRQLFDHEARNEWRQIRTLAPDTVFFGNIGISQLISTSVAQVRDLMRSLDAIAMIVHLNPLQECLQPEGTPQFRGGLKAIESLVKELGAPVIVKETGSGMSLSTMRRLEDAGVQVLDVSGLGGTHWGRIEGRRSPEGHVLKMASEAFQNWGFSTSESVICGKNLERAAVWASGGVRTGVDAAKLLALGAEMIGFAQPALENALKGSDALEGWFEKIETELRVAMFCTGSLCLTDLKGKIDGIE